MSTTITPRIGMRVILHMSHATGRAKREHLPPEFTGVIYAFDDNGADVRFFDHFGVAKEAHDVRLLPPSDDYGGWTTWCRPAPGEPESMPVDVIDARSIPVETELARVDAIPVRNPCTWDLSVVDTGVLVDEIRKRAPHLAAQPGEDLGCLREKAQAWDGVAQALNDTLGNWLQAGMSVAHSAVNQIHYQTGQAKAWMAVVQTLTEHWPQWTDRPTTGPACAAQAIADMAAKAKRQSYEDHEAIYAHTEFWKLVCRALDSAYHGWSDAEGSGQQRAVETIQRLGLEAAAWKAVVKTLDQVAPNWDLGHGSCLPERACAVIRQALAVVNFRELNEVQAFNLARKKAQDTGVFCGDHWRPSQFVLDAIIAASRGEGGG